MQEPVIVLKKTPPNEAQFPSYPLHLMEYNIPIAEEGTPITTDFPRYFHLVDTTVGTRMLRVFVLQKHVDANSPDYQEIMGATEFYWRTAYSKAPLAPGFITVGRWSKSYTEPQDQWVLFVKPSGGLLLNESLHTRVLSLEQKVAALQRALEKSNPGLLAQIG